MGNITPNSIFIPRNKTFLFYQTNRYLDTGTIFLPKHLSYRLLFTHHLNDLQQFNRGIMNPKLFVLRIFVRIETINDDEMVKECYLRAIQHIYKLNRIYK